MSNLVTPAVVADKMLEFMDTLSAGELIGKVNRQYENVLLQRKGQSFTVKKPPKYESQDGPVISSLQTINQGRVTVTASNWKTVPLELTGMDLTMNEDAFDDWAENFLKPAASRILADVTMSLTALYKDIYNHVGTPGTPPAAYSALADARELLTYGNAPKDDRHAALHPKAWNKLTSGLAGGFNPQDATGKMVRTGNLFPIAGFDPFEEASAPNHTVGAYSGTPLTNGSNQEGASLITDGWATSTTIMKRGDAFTVADVYGVNQITGESTGLLQEFTATADVTTDGSGNATISISPAIIADGAFKTVNAKAADGKTITMKTGTASTAYGQSLAFHRNAFGLCMASIRAPKGLQATTRNYKGLSITICTGPDIMNFSEIWRADAAWAATTFWPELACRVTN